MQLIFATHNAHKLEEIQSLLNNSFELLSLSDVGFYEEIPEDFETLKENALQKANTVYTRFNVDCFADDSGLEIDALNGRPGVHSAHYAGERNAEANIDKVLKEMNGIKERNARFRTVISLIHSGEAYFFEGIIEGKIGESRSGDSGFGYDPIFIPEGQDRSFAEMPLEEKNTQSHRGRAFEKFVKFLNEL